MTWRKENERGGLLGAYSITAVVASNAIEFNGELSEWSRTADFIYSLIAVGR